MTEQATINDIPALCALLNQAYRGDASRAGWTTEADLISGTVRTTPEALTAVLQKPGSVILLHKEGEQIIGCVNLQQREQRLYLGMLSVAPQLQGKGTGKLLLQAAEVHAKTIGLLTI
jgi:predicted N-acetyltransferase YhbS